MTVPDYQTFMLPVLQVLADSAPHRRGEIAIAAANALELTDAQRDLVIPSGRVPIYRNRAGWALTYLKQAGLIRAEARGVYRITERGLAVLSRELPRIDNDVLKEFAEFRDFLSRSQSGDSDETIERASAEAAPQPSPEEALQIAYRTLREALVSQLLEALKGVTPARFETIVVDVLQAMGYGGGRAGAARAIGKSGDGGIDGVIEEDRLGLDTVYVQAKRWEGNVSRPTVQAFAGALQGQRANKGVMISTSDFTGEAQQYVAGLSTRIVLIDGRRFAEMMIDHGVGVSLEQTYAVKRLDGDYFEE